VLIFSVDDISFEMMQHESLCLQGERRYLSLCFKLSPCAVDLHVGETSFLPIGKV